MNNQRRKLLSKLTEQLRAKCQEVADLQADLESLREDLERVKDDEQDSFDNMPESLQQGERGEAMEDAIAKLDTAFETLSGLDSELEQLGDGLEEAIEEIELVVGA